MIWSYSIQAANIKYSAKAAWFQYIYFLMAQLISPDEQIHFDRCNEFG